MAFAAKHKMNLGGIVSYVRCDEVHFDHDHGLDIVKFVSGVLGLEDPYDLYADFRPPAAREFRGIDSLLRSLHALGDGEDVLVSWDGGHRIGLDIDSDGRTNTDYWNPDFLAALRRQDTPLAHVPLQFKPNQPTVAMHVRRGDLLVDGNAATRITPDEWYFRIVDHIKARFGDSRPDIHVFTELAGKPAWVGGERVPTRPHSASEFEEYAKRGMTLHFDGDPLEAWAHFIHADVFLMAKSEFSWVPALWSERCVLYQKSWIRPLPSWIAASDGNWLRRTKKQPEFWFDEDKLDSCIADVKARLEQ